MHCMPLCSWWLCWRCWLACRQTLIWITLIYKPTPQHILCTIFAIPRGVLLIEELSTKVSNFYVSTRLQASFQMPFSFNQLMFGQLISLKFMRHLGMFVLVKPQILVYIGGDWPNILWRMKVRLSGVSVRIRPWSRCQQIARCLFPHVEAHSPGLRWAWHKVFVLIGCW